MGRKKAGFNEKARKNEIKGEWRDREEVRERERELRAMRLEMRNLNDDLIWRVFRDGEKISFIFFSG